jgi:hypothetical protein
VADQAEEPVKTPERFPAPDLLHAAEDLELLIDYAMTRYYFFDQTAEAIVQALGKYDKCAVLAALQTRVAATPNPYIIGRSYEICAQVLGQEAETWIRTQWQDPGPLNALAEASAACLPTDEGLVYTMAALNALPVKERIEACQALDWFQSPQSLDWIEAHANEIGTWISPHWGYLAANGHLTWDRVARWLDVGRPLSLVALAALKACGHWDTMISKVLRPRLHQPATRNVMTHTLQLYATHDAVPRVERDVGWIIAHWDVILGEGNASGEPRPAVAGES